MLMVNALDRVLSFLPDAKTFGLILCVNLLLVNSC